MHPCSEKRLSMLCNEDILEEKEDQGPDRGRQSVENLKGGEDEGNGRAEKQDVHAAEGERADEKIVSQLWG